MSAPTPSVPAAPSGPAGPPSSGPAFQRESHDHDGGLAVFLIGMRVNQPWRPDLWAPVFGAMPRMLAELYAAKAAHARGEADDLGFLDGRTLIGAGGPTLVQYWRSAEHIYAYASDRDREHHPAMRAFYARSRRATGAVGIWHETFAVPAGAHESLYLAMPPTGLGKAFGLTSDVRRRRHARLPVAG
ncbi:DUF4188 domain-containing protein [Humibacillus xanthopallidus]|uniref:Uncharacterized protein DUF4188 n=1 Tax=Humibacillus xanthopallidus TaxID=412689 RepID=A0A543HW55_9MICO|nr:DUF4188 domain-containing protein [Humibacillus xanthopallidus]TQM62522.1 uncharacterized protein DUF4188 [Humibacillus xanthopallidus]